MDPIASEGIRWLAQSFSRTKKGPSLAAIVLADLPVLNPWCIDDEKLFESKYSNLDVPLGLLRAFRIALVNTGTEAFLSKNYGQPIHLELYGEAQLVDLKMSWRPERRPFTSDDIEEQIHINDDRFVVIRPPIFNPDDALLFDGLAVYSGPELDVRLTVRYPGLAKVEMLRLGRTKISARIENVDIDARQLRWVHLRRLSPRLLRFSRASQLQRVAHTLLHLDESN